MRFVYVDFIPGSTTPARVYRKTGVVLINRSRFDHLPEFTKKFILKHEEGHHKLNTTNEFLADEYASNALLLTEPESLKKSIDALDKVLPKTTHEQNLRIRAQVKRALITDAAIGNKEAAEALKNLTEMENNFEGTYINPNESFKTKQFLPNVGKSFNDRTGFVDQNSFLNKTQSEALGFKNESFVQKIGAVKTTSPIYESGKTLTDKVTLEPSTDTKELKTSDDNLAITEDKNSETSIQIKISNPLFYYLLGIITVLVIALIINLFNKN